MIADYYQYSILRYHLFENSTVKVSIIDLLGKEVMQIANEKQNPGDHQLNLNTNQLQSGVYFVNLSVNSTGTTQKILVHHN